MVLVVSWLHNSEVAHPDIEMEIQRGRVVHTGDLVEALAGEDIAD